MVLGGKACKGRLSQMPTACPTHEPQAASRVWDTQLRVWKVKASPLACLTHSTSKTFLSEHLSRESSLAYPIHTREISRTKGEKSPGHFKTSPDSLSAPPPPPRAQLPVCDPD